jgi:hypothetical protein
MDGSTESLIAVVGHPIAGNPAQFALERAFEAMRLDWRVLSFDVPAARLGVALGGIDALGFRGVLADETISVAVTQWCEQNLIGAADRASAVDCLYRDAGGSAKFRATCAEGEWMLNRVRGHFETRGRSVQRTLWIARPGSVPPPWLQELSGGARLSRTPERSQSPDFEAIQAADLIALGPRSAKARALECDLWPPNDQSTVVVDLTAAGDPAAAVIAQLGYRVISREERRLGTLLQCIRRWAGLEPPPEVIQDAIEEYWAV